MLRTAKSGLIAIAAAAALLAGGHRVQAAPFLGEQIDTLVQFGGPAETRTDSVGDPAIEIQSTDANAFSWMLGNDYIDFTHNALIINFDGAHDFGIAQELHFEFKLTSGNFWNVGAMAIVKAINVNQISGSVSGDTFTLDIFDPENANEFGGLIEVRILNVADTGGAGPVLQVPAPSPLPLMAAALAALATMRLRAARRTV